MTAGNQVCLSAKRTDWMCVDRGEPSDGGLPYSYGYIRLLCERTYQISTACDRRPRRRSSYCFGAL